MSGRRLLLLLVMLAAIGIPAGVLQALCVGRSCEDDTAEARVPFCPLPASLKEELGSGYYEGRSPDVLGVARDTAVYTEIGGMRLPWPATGVSPEARVPLVFAGPGIDAGGDVPDGVTLDRVAPTIADALGFVRPFPSVRSGTPVDGVVGSAAAPRLVLLIAWKGIGSAELEDQPDRWPFLASLLDEGAGTLDAATGSLPLDPAATMTTIGTGGLPSQHGITGSFVRNDVVGAEDRGEVVPAFGAGSPLHVIATLADDLEEADRRTLVGLVGTDEVDRGLVGGGWYEGQDPVDVILGDPGAGPLAVQTHLATGYGADDVADILAVALEGGIRSLDRRTRQIVTAAREATDGSVLMVVAGTGPSERSPVAVSDAALEGAVEEAVPGEAAAIAATVPGGIFLDQASLTAAEVTGQVAVDALLSVTGSDDRAVLADAFQGFAVSFARYC